MLFAAPRPESPEQVPGVQVVLTLKSSPAAAAHDLHVFPWSIFQVGAEMSPTGGRMTIHAALMKPLSRGRLRLRSPDPAAAPIIDPGFFTHPDDMPRMLLAVRTARQLASSQPMSAFALRELMPGPAITDDIALAAAIRAGIGTYFHPVGTCCMGPDTNPMAVVDPQGRVHGIEGLSRRGRLHHADDPGGQYEPADHHAGGALRSLDGVGRGLNDQLKARPQVARELMASPRQRASSSGCPAP